MAVISLKQLLDCLAVERLDEDRWLARNLELPSYYRIFGGQLLAQAIAIGALEAPGKSCKSLHVLFPREGDLAQPVEYRVERLHDGRSFASRLLVGAQQGRAIFSAALSLHVADAGGLEHQTPAPACPPPEACLPGELGMIPLEVRIAGGVDLAGRAAGPPEFRFWLRASEALPHAPAIHQAILAHCSDLTVIATALRPCAGWSVADSPERLHTGPTSHTIWFHRPFRADQWLLIDQRAPSLAGGRGFGGAHVYADGRQLVASFAQEALVRERQPA
jgi:acyl-CoA thioesterase-2